MTASAAPAIARRSKQATQRRAVFRLSAACLFTSAFSTALRAATASGIKAEWIDPVAPSDAGRLTGEALGASFLGFAVTLFVTSAFVGAIGPRRMLFGCGLAIALGTASVLLADALTPGVDTLTVVWAGMLLCGVGWGLAESCINPLIASAFPEDSTHRLNMLHAWWPAGLIIGGLAGYMLGEQLPWRSILALAIVPAALVAGASLFTSFPDPHEAGNRASIKTMLVEVARRPSFFIWFGAMFLTAATELAPGQWVDIALTGKVGMRGILLLVYVSALMFVLRHFIGRLARILSNPGLLWMSSLLAALGLLTLARANSPATALLAATIWGAGVCAMWPTMLASVAERYPRGGSWTMGLIGSAGALSIYFVLPALGTVYDDAKIRIAGGGSALAALHGSALRTVENEAAAHSFDRAAAMPLALLIIFGVLWVREKRAARHPIEHLETVAEGTRHGQ